MIKLDFEIDGKKYSELFALDPSLCPCFHSKKSKAIAGVLGNGFLLRHKWILDYSGMWPSYTVTLYRNVKVGV